MSWFAELADGVWARDHGVCVACGRPARKIPACFHHVLPKNRWPELTLCPENVRVVCEDCHSKHETGHTRLPRAVADLLEEIGLPVRGEAGNRQRSYLDRVYGPRSPQRPDSRSPGA